MHSCTRRVFVGLVPHFFLRKASSFRYVPGGLTGEEQPLDIATNRPFKSYIQQHFVSWFGGLEVADRLSAGSLPVLKPLCARWVDEAAAHVQQHADTMIIAGWRKAGLLDAFDIDTQQQARAVVDPDECDELPTVRTYLSREQIVRMTEALGAALPPELATSPANIDGDDAADEAAALLPADAVPVAADDGNDAMQVDSVAGERDNHAANNDNDDDDRDYGHDEDDDQDGADDYDDDGDFSCITESLQLLRLELEPRRSTRSRSQRRDADFVYDGDDDNDDRWRSTHTPPRYDMMTKNR
jgi:hypothetical protein